MDAEIDALYTSCPAFDSEAPYVEKEYIKLLDQRYEIYAKMTALHQDFDFQCLVDEWLDIFARMAEWEARYYFAQGVHIGRNSVM